MHPATRLHSRGCPAMCTFCLAPDALRLPLAAAFVDDVVNEVAWARELPGVKEFFFDDDTFNYKAARTGFARSSPH